MIVYPHRRLVHCWLATLTPSILSHAPKAVWAFNAPLAQILVTTVAAPLVKLSWFIRPGLAAGLALFRIPPTWAWLAIAQLIVVADFA